MPARNPIRLGMGAVVALVAACSIPGVTEPGLVKSAHPLDVEQGGTPATATACEEAPIITVGDLGGDAAPADGTRVAIEGHPEARILCNLLACNFECCDNRCGGGYLLPMPTEEQPHASVDLRSPDFVCGGTDCSHYCTPFSSKPQERYRFVGAITRGQSGSWHLAVTSWCLL